jgi:hypothetical protein
MTGFVAATDTKNYVGICDYLLPSGQAKCRSLFGSVSPSVLAAKMPFAKNPGLGYVAIDGTQALVGTVGEYCSPGQTPECFTNTDPAAILSSGKPFSALWKTAVAQANSSSGSANTYSLYPCLEVGGKWYADLTGF